MQYACYISFGDIEVVNRNQETPLLRFLINYLLY